ncbi:MAG: type II secretion system F family protein [Candidatus Diapherotrites archaeon]|uniref:Type II secretion system F family protein n=1 Tax=Candidatus Iainarchaeum sp. TaxID=3101447 RepID=A0A7J4IRB4_9ARCH|nr:MAG: archaeal flagellar protein FlaJ [archaeon GW2011_AR10]MBS3059771.1 type II secretion system F family protein [Candidatus Diapherotrites archaeon]HIH07962.1 type II secretion system F family protein [Candidatus Diapherotrites archaeon]
MGIYSRVSGMLPKSITRAFKRQLDYLGIEIGEKRVVGFLFLYGFLLSLGLAFNISFMFGINALFTFAFFFGLFVGGTYLWLNVTAESKGRFVETILPDALQLVASNVKAGLTTERALLVSARPEFGPLEKELRKAAKRISAGETVVEALAGISEKIKSKTLEKTIWLISEGIRSGGEIADLLIELADDLREQQALEAETAANISMYILLIFFSAAIGAPMLFGISSFIVQILAVQSASTASLEVGEAANIPANIQGVTAMITGKGNALSPDFIIFFTMISLVITSIFASLTIGVINNGSEKSGVKFIPAILFVSFSLFFIIRIVLTTLFGSLL